jgi:hypothetical protein
MPGDFTPGCAKCRSTTGVLCCQDEDLPGYDAPPCGAPTKRHDIRVACTEELVAA